MMTRRTFTAGAAALAGAGLIAGPMTAQAAPGGGRISSPFPFKLFDSHLHFYTDDTAQFPLVKELDPRLGGTANLAERVKADPNRIDRVLQWWDEAGIEGGAGVQYRTAYGLDNSYLLSAAGQSGGRVAPIMTVDGTDPTVPGSLCGLARDHGLTGIRMSGRQVDGGFPWLDSPAVLRTWDAVSAQGLLVVLMVQPPHIAPDAAAAAFRRIGAMAARFPQVNIVLDHLGWPPPEAGPGFGLTPERVALRQQPNIYFKFTSAGLETLTEAKLPTADFLRHAVDTFGADRMMWGSDLGNTPGDYQHLLDWMNQATAKLTPAETQRFMRETGQRLHIRGGRGGARCAA